MSSFGNTTHNPFTVNTTGNASMSFFGNSNNLSTGTPVYTTPTVFIRDTHSNVSSMPSFGNTSNSSHNLFNTTGNASMPSFGNTSNSAHNPFTVNTTGNASMPSFGNTSNLSHNPFSTNGNASMPSFGNTNNLTHNPFPVNTTGKASMPSFGNMNNSTANPIFGNTTGNVPFGNTNNSTPNPVFGNTTGNTSMSIFGNTNNSTPNPFAVKRVGNTTSPSLPSQRISFDGTSTGMFGVKSSPFTTSSFNFGVTAGPTGTFGSPAPLTNHVGNNSFGFGPFQSTSAFISQSTGSNFGKPSNAPVGLNSSTSIFAGTNTSVSNAGSFTFGTNSNSGSYSAFAFGVTQAPPTENKGSKINPYAVTNDPVYGKLQSISCMPIYDSKCHEELRWEDYELKSKGTLGFQTPYINTTSKGLSSSSFSPQLPDSTSQNPFLRSTPLLNVKPSSTFLPSPALVSNLTSSTTAALTTSPINPWKPAFPQPSSPFTSTSLTNLAPSTPAPFSNSTISNTLTPSSPFTSSSFTNLAPCTAAPFSNSTITNTLTPSFPELSFNQYLIPVNPAPPSTSTTSSTLTGDFPKSLMKSDTQLPWTSWPTLPGTGNSQTNATAAASTTPSLTGKNGGSTDKMTPCIIAVQDPFGTQSVTSQSHPSTVYPICSPLIRTGISSMPVIDKPAATRTPSLLTSRHISPRPLTMRARKYHPRNDEPKVAFFDHTNETQITPKISIVIPRANPTSMFEATSKQSEVSSTKDEMTGACTLLLEDGGVKAEKDQPISSTTCDMEHKKSINEKHIRVNASVKLHRFDYYTQPSIEELRLAEISNPGYCSHVKEFVVGRHGYGCVKIEGETDIRGLDLDAIVSFNKLEVVVYEDENEKPEVGEGLNKGAEVTLLNVKCTDKTGKQYNSGKMVDKFVEKLKKVAENQGAEFVSYDAVNGVWKFHVEHFSRYGIIPESVE